MSGSKPYTFDTNILFYAIDTSAGAKHGIARELVAKANRQNTFLVLQVLGELFHSVHRKQKVHLQAARDFILYCLKLLDVTHVESVDVPSALDLQAQHNIPFWDALLIVAVQRCGGTILLSEDFQHDRLYGTVRVIDPFKLSPDALATLLTFPPKLPTV